MWNFPGHNMSSTPPGQQAGIGQDQSRFQRNITDGDFEFLKFLSHDDLTARSQIICFGISLWEKYIHIFCLKEYIFICFSWSGCLGWTVRWRKKLMISDGGTMLRGSAHECLRWLPMMTSFSSRQPILDAMDQKRKRQQNFWFAFTKSQNNVLNLLKSPKIWMGAASVFHPGSSNAIGSSRNIARLWIVSITVRINGLRYHSTNSNGHTPTP